jgi:ABC-type amino acid transport substrate-binding protein/serine phosphatase RsbU (regulator of sigma subunit)/PAS domain-containing protein
VGEFKRFCTIAVLLISGIFLTPATVLAANPDEITVAIDRGNPPYALEGIDGKPRGLLVDIWNLWGETTGIRVKFIQSSWADTLKNLREGKTDVHMGMFKNEQRAEWIDFAEPYHEIKSALYFLTNKDRDGILPELGNARVGVVAGTFQEFYLRSQYPNAKVTGFEDNEQSIRALALGKIDYATGVPPTFEALLEQLGFKREVTRGADELISNTLHVGVKKENGTLLRRIEEGFSAIEFEKLAELDEYWLPNPADRFYRRAVDTVELTREEEDWLAVHPFLRFAVTDFINPVDILNKDGTYVGLNADLIVLLNKKLGTRIVPEFFSQWSDLVDASLSGEVDGVFSFSRTPEREQHVFFTKPYAFDPIVVITRQDNTDIKGWPDIAGKKVTILKGFAIAEEARTKIAGGELIEVDKAEDALRMLALDEIDAHIDYLIPYGNALKESGVTGLKIADARNTESAAFRIAIHKDQPFLFSIIQKGVNALTRAELAALNSKWMTPTQDSSLVQDKLNLTQEERHWLDLHDKIEVGMMSDWPPFSFVDDSGIKSGISPAFVEAINKRLGGRLKLRPGPWKEHLESLKEGRIDALVDLTPSDSRREIYNFTNPYLTIPHVIIGPRDGDYLGDEKDLKGKTLALEKGFGNVKYFRENFPNVKIKEFQNTSEALGAVSRGEADAYAGNRAVATYLLEKEVILNLKAHGRLDKPGSVLAIGVRKNWPVLTAILQKALDDIGQEESREILKTWVGGGDTAPETASLPLSEKEKNWLGGHKSVRVMVGTWPPFHFMENGKPKGMALDFVQTALAKAGVKPEFVSIDWAEALEGISNFEKIDLLPTIAYSPEREKLVAFTSPYLSFPRVIFARKDDNSIGSFADLKGRTVAVEKNFITQKLLEKDHPEIKLEIVNSSREALEAVSFGKADAFVSNLAVGSYLLGEMGLLNLKVAASTNYKNDVQSMGVRKDWPELASILEKALDSLSEIEKRNIRDRWISSVEPPESAKTEVDSKEMVLQIGIGVIVMVGLLLAMVMAMRVLEGKDNSSLYQSKELKGLGLLLIGLFLCVVVLSAWYTVKSVEERTRRDIGHSLQTILHSTHEALKLWTERKQVNIETIAQSFAVRTQIRNLLEVPREPDVLLKSSELFQVRNMLESEKKRTGDTGFFVIAPNGISIGSLRDENIGTTNLIYQQKKALLDRVFKGQTVLIPPIVSDIKLEEGNKIATMFMVAPVMDLTGKKVIAALAMRLDPGGEFSSIIQLGRMGLSGETYSFDRDGELMSESRFKDDLLKAGLLGENEEAILQIRVADPGGNLLEGHPLPQDIRSQPLTTMAMEATKGKSGLNVEGYRDYRGVPVMGAWLWDEKLGFGMTTEVDVDESLNSYFTIRDTLVIVLGLTVLMALILTGLSTWIGRSANRSLRKARDDLERKVEERTVEVAEKEAQLRMAMDTMTDGLFMLDANLKFVLLNDHYRELVEMPDELIQIGTSITDVIKAHAERGDYGPGDAGGIVRKRRLSLLNDQIVDAELSIKNGKRILSLRKAPIAGGGAVVALTEITERKKAEEEISQQRQNLNYVLENVGQGIVRWGADQKLISWNRHYQEVLRLPDEILEVGAHLKNITLLIAGRGDYGEGEVEEIAEARIAYLMSGEESRNELTIDNDKIYDVHITPIDDGGIIITYTNITERKKAELELTDAYDVISDSIDYAARIQRSVLPDNILFSSIFVDHFVLWEPRDVVGGDIYWSRMWGDGSLVILGDCTGHGVPGAFMTLIATGALDNALSDIAGGQVAQLLQRLHQLVQTTLGQHGEGSESDDGMELGICFLDANMDKVIFAGARFELYVVEDGNVSTIKGTKSGIGYHGISHNQEYGECEIVNLPGKSFYMTSDGLVDQVGGERNRMYGKKRFRELLLEINDKPMKNQQECIHGALVEYQGGQRRRDDVAVIGFKVE